MHRLITFALLLFFAATLEAHPSVSVVIDSRGNVYYSDLSQVWQIASDGTKRVVVPGVHAHELAIDPADNLYGEHLWYEGEQIDKWGHYVWKRSPDGRVTKVIPNSEGFLKDYSFVRDRAGSMYFADRDASLIKRRLSGGRIETLARHPFRDIRWMTVSPDGMVFLVDKHDLLRISPRGEVTTISREMSHPPRWRSDYVERHALMGLWLDPGGNVYVADYAEGVVKRVTRDGRVAVIARSRLPWAATGGAWASTGELWLLEWSMTNQVRLRRLERGGRERIY